jgi:hypothetical protein
MSILILRVQTNGVMHLISPGWFIELSYLNDFFTLLQKCNIAGSIVSN